MATEYYCSNINSVSPSTINLNVGDSATVTITYTVARRTVGTARTDAIRILAYSGAGYDTPSSALQIVPSAIGITTTGIQTQTITVTALSADSGFIECSSVLDAREKVIDFTVASSQKTLTIKYNSTVISTSSIVPPVSITYNDRVIGSASAGSNLTLTCAGKLMESNVTVGDKILSCGGKIASGNIEVIISS